MFIFCLRRDIMDWYKPLVKANGKGMTIIFLLAGIVMVVLGVYFGFVQGKDYVKTTAVITRIVEEEDPSAENGIAQRPIVTYTAGGKEYTEKLDSWDPSYETGKEIKVRLILPRFWKIPLDLRFTCSQSAPF